VVSPLPASFFWPGVLLPALMAAFLAEGSKFLFFDTSICRNAVWYPSGDESLPRMAEDCSLGTTGNYAIAGGTIFFCSLILVCLKAPEIRELDTNYGTDLERNESDVESAHDHQYANSEGSFVDNAGDMYVQNISANNEQAEPYTGSNDSSSHLIATLGSAHTEAQELQFSPRRSRKDDSFNRLDGNQGNERLSATDSRDRADDRYYPSKPAPKPDPDHSVISESRLSTVEKMQNNNATDGSDELIQQFVSDLDMSFQVEEEGESDNNKEAQTEIEQPSLLQNLCGPAETSL
jgi:hypothetical protein